MLKKIFQNVTATAVVIILKQTSSTSIEQMSDNGSLHAKIPRLKVYMLLAFVMKKSTNEGNYLL